MDRYVLLHLSTVVLLLALLEVAYLWLDRYSGSCCGLCDSKYQLHKYTHIEDEIFVSS